MPDNLTFYKNLLKGRIGQVIVENIFRYFDFEVYPYGYESYLTNIIKYMQGGSSNDSVKKIRATPDMLVYNRVLNEAYFIEVKTTRVDPSNYWIAKSRIDSCKNLWSDAYLAIIKVPELDIYIAAISDLNFVEVDCPYQNCDEAGYKFDLNHDFNKLHEVFTTIPKEALKEYTLTIKDDILIDLKES